MNIKCTFSCYLEYPLLLSAREDEFHHDSVSVRFVLGMSIFFLGFRAETWNLQRARGVGLPTTDSNSTSSRHEPEPIKNNNMCIFTFATLHPSQKILPCACMTA